MFNSKYNKLLTGLLIIAIIVVLGILIYVGIDWYKAYTTGNDAEDGSDQFNGYINNTIATKPSNNEENNSGDLIEPDINVNNTATNTNGNGNGGGTTSNRPKYKGFYMVGKIEIPKIKLNCPVLEKATDSAIEVAVAVLNGPGINQVGNTVIIGHNYRNGTFFSNNKKLELEDKIYLTDLSGKKVTYTITKKYITNSEDADYMVRDTKGKREISLSTCTDDVNSKKRLVIWAEEK